jgi:heptosyltransferase-2
MLEKAEGRIGGGMRGGPLVTLVVGSNWETKRWPSSRFAFLARELVARGMHVAVEGGPGDAAIGKEVMSVAGDGVTDLTGNSIAEAAAMIPISDLVIGGDTGLAQLARLAGRRVLMIFGPTDHSIHHFGPGQKAVHAGVPCRPCSRHGPNDCPEKHFSCMYSLSTDMVLHEALALFQ